MDPSRLMLVERKSQRRPRRHQTLSPPTLKARIPERVTSTYLGQEENESPSTQPIPPLALAEALSAQFRKRTQLPLISPLTTLLGPLHQTGLSSLKSSRRRYLTAFLTSFYSVITTVQATKPEWQEKLGAEWDSRTLQARFGATVLYAAFALNMRQLFGTMA
uniref:Uncharacterized protein n=1 Tax=Cherry green ring mottle virus TaxID=65467 RepID=V5LXD3_9VIRU|nr:hypothetical protein [Cherry green ring mottle virus]